MLTPARYIELLPVCRGAGIECLNKPVKPRDLLALLRKLFGGDRQGEDGQQTPDETGGSNGGRHLRILLVEDNRIDQKVVVTLLERLGHTVQVAGTGREAVELYQPGCFDLILMDVQMPEMDGLEAAARIRAQEAGGPRAPMVALTADAMSLAVYRMSRSEGFTPLAAPPNLNGSGS
jgi:CheY-like chemotaxis protein